MRPLFTTSLLLIMACTLSASLPGCLDGPEERVQGDRGYPCYFDVDCIAPLTCLSVPGTDFPICTGALLEGDPCNHDRDCAWLRDARGLPLSCLEATCAFPADNGAP